MCLKALIILDRSGILCHVVSLSRRKVSIRTTPTPSPSPPISLIRNDATRFRKVSKSANARYTAARCSCSWRSPGAWAGQNIIREFDERSLVNYCTRACSTCAEIRERILPLAWKRFFQWSLSLLLLIWNDLGELINQHFLYILFYIVFFLWRMIISKSVSFGYSNYVRDIYKSKIIF